MRRRLGALTTSADGGEGAARLRWFAGATGSVGARQLVAARARSRSPHALAVLATLLLAGAADAEAPTVAFDLSGLDAAAWERFDAVALEKRVVLRLVQDGLAVVSTAASPDLVVRMTASAEALHLTAVAPWQTLDREVPLTGAPLPELHLELAQKVALLARACLAARPPPLVVRAPAPAPPPPVVPVLAPVAPPPPLWWGGVGLGILGRSGGVDPWLAGRGRVGRTIGLRGQVALTFSRATGLGVVEAWAQLGFGYVFHLREALDLELGALAGARVHAWSTDGAGTALQLDFSGSFPISLTVWPHRVIGLTAELAPRATSVSVEHPTASQTWSRGAWGLEAAAYLVARW